MKRGEHITGYLAGAILALATICPGVSFAQHTGHSAPPPHSMPAPQRQAPAPQPQVRQAPQQRVPTPDASVSRPQGHAGDWLRRYKDLPPEEQERALQNDPAFRRLPPERQQLLRQRLQHFSNLPPQEQLRMLNRMETWEHLTPEQKQQARQIFGQMRQLPPDRRRMVHTAIDDLRSMPADQREQVINSERFKGMFSDQERSLMREATRLPLAPSDSGDQPGQPQE